MPNSFVSDPNAGQSSQGGSMPSSFTPDSSLSFGQSKAVLGHSNSLFMGTSGLAPTSAFTVQGIQQAKAQIGSTLPTVGAVAGGIGGAALGGLAGIETGPGAIATAYAGGVAGSGAGAALGETANEKLQGESLQPGEIAKQGGINAAFDAIGGPLLSGAGKIFDGTIGKVAGKIGDMFGGKPVADAVEKTISPPVKIATNRLSSTAETLTKGEREAAIKEGRMTDNGKYTPSKTEQRAGEIMQGKTYSNPVKTTKAVQDEISTRGKEAETYLEQNATKITNKEDYDAFNSAKDSSEKYMTPGEKSAYNEQVGVFQNILKSNAGDGGYTTANYYKSLKEYESQVTANLPKGRDALLTPGGSARVQGAKDVRTVVRNMIGEKNPEFKGKMYDLASLYDSLDNVVAKAEQGGHSLAKRYPKTATALGTAATIGGYEEAKKLPIVGGLLP